MTTRKRDIQEMILALDRHLSLLRDYAQKAFIVGDIKYAGEVAGKLRLLVTRFGRNHRPLLLDLMKEFDIEPMIILGGPPMKDNKGELITRKEITLEQYLGLMAVAIRVPAGRLVTMDKTDLIRAWAEKTGSSHEDWEITSDLDAVLSIPVYIGGRHSAIAELKTITDTVLFVADRFLEEVEQLD